MDDADKAEDRQQEILSDALAKVRRKSSMIADARLARVFLRLDPMTPHFTLDELTVSQEAARSGIKNTPNADQTESLRLLCVNVLEPLRNRVKRPIVVSSGFRSVTINRRIGGSQASQHCKGQAVDFSVPGMTPDEVCELVIAMKLPFDQLISEFGAWTHVSYSPRHRRQALRAIRQGGKTVYKEL